MDADPLAEDRSPASRFGVIRVPTVIRGSMTVNPSADALRQQFGDVVTRVSQSCGETIVYVEAGRVRDVLAWLKEEPNQAYAYLADVTAVEYRDAELPIEVVYQLFSLTRRQSLRIKATLAATEPLEIDSVVSLWRGADWMEREVYDMFGITFRGHPDLRRILMWETYAEGYPLRKDFPLRGRFSRAEQVRQALNANPEAHYSMEELGVAEAFYELPPDMRDRLARGERGAIAEPPDEARHG